jgi:fimbrial chaperone protein
LMRYSRPVFVVTAPTVVAGGQNQNAQPMKTDLSQIHAEVVAGPDGKAELRIGNTGAHAVRISALSAASSGGQMQSIDSGLVGYVLAGQQMTWPLNLPYPLPAGLALKARFDDDMQAQAVPLDGAGH